jgi:hypothetical protein
VTLVAGSAVAFTVSTKASPATVKRTGKLPEGLTTIANPNGTAILAGTPAADAAGSYTVTLTAKNSIGTATRTFTELVATAMATVGTPLNVRIVARGSARTVLSITGTLPPGVAFADKHDGTYTLTGTPNAGSAGTYDLTLIVTKGTTSTTQAVVVIVS